MTIAELIKVLGTLPCDAEVTTAKVSYKSREGWLTRYTYSARSADRAARTRPL